MGSLLSSEAQTRVRAPVLEVFASIQGEGAFVGQPQVFVRLLGCPFRCVWCDTPEALSVPREPRVRRSVAGKPPRREPGWASPFQVATWIGDAEGGPRRTISITGGEPLAWPDFVIGLRPFTSGRRLHLETAGGLVEALERVLPAVDHVSLDLKLPADLAPPVPLGPSAAPLPADEAAWAAARADALALLDGRDAAVKIVVAGGRPAEAYHPLLDDVLGMAPELPCILQPVTPRAGVRAPSPEELRAVVEAALERELSVRVVPQVHRFLGVP